MAKPDENGRGSAGPIGVIPGIPVVSVDDLPKPKAPVAAVSSQLKWVPIDFVVKDDGDFTAGPGEFIPVPNTKMTFWMEHDGPVTFAVQSTFGFTRFPARHDHLGIMVDRGIYPLSSFEAMQAVPGLGIFKFGAPSFWPMNLQRGEHVAQVLIRGSLDDGEVKIGLALPCKVLANPKNPLSFMVFHS